MKKWLKRISMVTIAASLLASGANSFSPSVANAQTSWQQNLNNQFQETNQLQFLKNQNAPSQSSISDDTLVIKFTKPLTTAEHNRAGGTLVKQFSDLHYMVVKVKDLKKVSKTIENYQRLSHVISVSPSAQYLPLSIPDPKATVQYQNDLLHLAAAQGLAGKNKVIVAVIDQGIDTRHPDLLGKLLPGYNAVNPMNQGLPDFHGTHVAGIIAAAKNNGIGGYGVNPNAKLLPIDVFNRKGGASDYSIADGILYAVNHGAKIINMSLGGALPSPIIEDAVKKALAKNVTIVAASGNTGDAVPQYPAAYEGVISVGSINSEKKLSSFSTYGTSLDLVAPGEEIYSTIYEYEKKSTFRKLSGTSMATPMVSGAISLLLSKYPKLTPIQVEYILKNTALDLGPKGFDVYYGSGLINPLAALKFDIKKLPNLSSQPVAEKEIPAKAVLVKLSGTTTLSDSITKPYEERWYKADVKKGDKLQFVLDGATWFDYKLMIRMSSSDQTLEVNKVREGKKEGKLYTVPSDGTILFAVKDVNGGYDDSGLKLNRYTLKIRNTTELPGDESTFDKPMAIEFPFKSDTNKLIGDDGDDDFYSFSVKESKAIKIGLGAIPGVDASISIYTADQLVPATEDDNEGVAPTTTEAGGEVPVTEGPVFDPSEEEPMYYANNGSYSEGESLIFMADPDTNYVIMVSNKKVNNYRPYDYVQNPGMMEANQNPDSSLEPYKLEVDGKVLPDDEDMFPVSTSSNLKNILTIVNQQVGSDKSNPTDNDYVGAVTDGALDYEISTMKSGYLQSSDDEDWFAVTPDETGIYKFAFKDAGPLMSVYKITEQTDPDGNVSSFLDQVGTNISWQSGQTGQSFYSGLKKDITYYIKINSNYYDGGITFDPYQFSVKLAIANPQDAYEDNDSLEKVTKNLPTTEFEGNFATANDVDAFYLQGKATQVYAVSFSRKAISAAWRNRYPAELINKFTGVITVVEDSNKNHRIDPDELDKVQIIDNTTQNGFTYGSFKTEKNKNYIVVVTGSIDAPVPLSLWPYLMKVSPVNLKDEDKGSIVKKNVPSKPLTLKAAGKNQWQASGNLNADVPYGDEDWYVLKVTNDMKGKIELAAGAEIDGTISLYKDGKQLATSDYYSEGDTEVLNFSLKKGNYYIKIRDINGNSTINPYKLTVKFN